MKYLYGRKYETAPTYDAYLRTHHWRRTRSAALERAGHCCSICNGDGPLQVHHRTYVRLFHEWPTDLVVLCCSCHALFHRNGRLKPDTSCVLGAEAMRELESWLHWSVRGDLAHVINDLWYLVADHLAREPWSTGRRVMEAIDTGDTLYLGHRDWGHRLLYQAEKAGLVTRRRAPWGKRTRSEWVLTAEGSVRSER